MPLRKADGPLVVHVPPAEADQTSWARVGAIAAIGFVIGVAWPRLTGVRLGPSVPEAATPVVSAAPAAPAPSGVRSTPVAAAMTASASPSVPPSAAPPSAAPSGDVAPARFRGARVKWEVAIVRDAPRTGKIVARLQRGTDVRVGALDQGWYPVKYGDGFANEGWVYRGALGK